MTVEGGDAIRTPGLNGAPPSAPGTISCLVRLSTHPDRLLILAAGHTLLQPNSGQFDPVESPTVPGQPLGQLLGWTSLNGATTVDAALVWADPDLVEAACRVGVLGDATGTLTNEHVQEGDELSIYSRASAQTCKVTVSVGGLNQSVQVTMPSSAGGQVTRFYNQIICRPGVTLDGDSGTIVVDAQNRVVGMVVAGLPQIPDEDDQGYTVVTPISAILNHPDWRGAVLNVENTKPAGCVKPPQVSVALPASSTPTVATRGPIGIDTSIPVNAGTLAAAKTAITTTPTFWGRYFHAPGQIGSTGKVDPVRYAVSEGKVLAAHQIPLLPLAQQTLNISSDSTVGQADAVQNIAALLEAFSLHDLIAAEGETVMFLDCEGDPGLTADYYVGWSTKLVQQAASISGGLAKILPCIYTGAGNQTTWSALSDALGAGGLCFGLWVAAWGPKDALNPATARDWSSSSAAAHGLNASVPILAWQYSCQDAFDATELNPANAASTLKRLIVPTT